MTRMLSTGSHAKWVKDKKKTRAAGTPPIYYCMHSRKRKDALWSELCASFLCGGVKALGVCRGCRVTSIRRRCVECRLLVKLTFFCMEMRRLLARECRLLAKRSSFILEGNRTTRWWRVTRSHTTIHTLIASGSIVYDPLVASFFRIQTVDVQRIMRRRPTCLPSSYRFVFARVRQK